MVRYLPASCCRLLFFFSTMSCTLLLRAMYIYVCHKQIVNEFMCTAKSMTNHRLNAKIYTQALCQKHERCETDFLVGMLGV